MLRLLLCARFVLLVLLSGWSLSASAVSVGPVDDFEDGSTQGWEVGENARFVPAVIPLNVPDGGPSGAGDGFLRLNSIGGSGSGSRLTVQNALQWSGDYLGAGVAAIALDVNNLGTTELILRLLIGDAIANSPPNSALTAGIALPAGSGWQSILFSLAPEDLVPRTGTTAAALAGAAQLRLFHGPSPVFEGPAIAATLGVDNIRAIPEPGSGLLLAASLLALGATQARVRRTAPRGRCRPGAAASR